MGFIVTLAGCLLGLTGCMFFMQRKMIYIPGGYEPSLVNWARESLVEIGYDTTAGRQASFFVPPRAATQAPPGPIWILCGGNGARALDWIDFAEEFPDPTAAFLLFDYPGYGVCEGKPSREAIRVSLEAAVKRLAETQAVPQADIEGRISVLGHSLGAAVALEYAASHGARRVVMVSPFTSLEAMAKRTVGWPLCKIVLDRYDNAARLGEMAAREPRPAVTIVHGGMDDIVPVAMGRSLAARHPGWISYREIAGADHNYILDMAKNEIWEAMKGR